MRFANRHRMRFVVTWFALAVVACHAPAKPDASATGNIVPAADHHQHLVSPALVASFYPPPLEAIAVPADVGSVLSRIEAGWNDPAALAKLMTDAVILRTTEGAGWARGRTAVSEELGTRFARPYRIAPVAFRREGRMRTWKAFSREERERSASTLARSRWSWRKAPTEPGRWTR
jgi:hypothetical protein